MSKFAWPFRKFAEAMPPAPRSLTKERNAHPPAVAISKHPQRDKPRPARLMWTQLILRAIALTANLSAIIIAIFVSVGPTHRAWPVVFISVSLLFQTHFSRFLQWPATPFRQQSLTPHRHLSHSSSTHSKSLPSFAVASQPSKSLESTQLLSSSSISLLLGS